MSDDADRELPREDVQEAGEACVDRDKPLYVISVAAELVDMHPQTLRLYERKGLIEPSRSAGQTRLYSQRNIEQLREIRRLTQELGVNLAGVEEIIKLRDKLDDLQASMERRIGHLQGRLEERMGGVRGALPAAIQDLAREMNREGSETPPPDDGAGDADDDGDDA